MQFLFQPGHFGCNSVWYTHLPVHQRLMDTSGRTGISRGMKTIRSVLDRFGVRNRKDMFVYKDSTGAVFYFRLVIFCDTNGFWIAFLRLIKQVFTCTAFCLFVYLFFVYFYKERFTRESSHCVKNTVV